MGGRRSGRTAAPNDSRAPLRRRGRRVTSVETCSPGSWRWSLTTRRCRRHYLYLRRYEWPKTVCLCSAQQSFLAFGRKKFSSRRACTANGIMAAKKDARLWSAFVVAQIQSETRVTRRRFFLKHCGRSLDRHVNSGPTRVHRPHCRLDRRDIDRTADHSLAPTHVIDRSRVSRLLIELPYSVGQDGELVVLPLVVSVVLTIGIGSNDEEDIGDEKLHCTVEPAVLYERN